MKKCFGRQGIETECWKNQDDGERNARRNCIEKIHSCGMCGKRVGSNTVRCTQCMKRIHGRCMKMKKVTCSSA